MTQSIRNTIAGWLLGIRITGPELRALADGVDGQCGLCVTPEGAASVTLNTKSQRLTERFSAGAMQALAAMFAASVTALSRVNRNT